MKYIGRYEVERKLGQGAMGVVFLGRDPERGRPVAIKTFDVGDSPNDEEWQWLRERLLAEGTRTRDLDHPNIVKVFEVVDDGELSYIVMEYVSGVTLDEYLATHGTPAHDMVLQLLRQTASGLDYAHGQGIVHRDIKPANLMIDDAGNVKITDFGIAKRVGVATNTGLRLGTPEFMSPEQMEGLPDVGGPADQFSLATLAYFLLTGQKAFEAETLRSLTILIASKDPVPPSQVNPQLPRNVDAVFRKAMAKTPASRYRTCLEFVDSLEQALMDPLVKPPRPLIPLLIVLLVGLALIGVAAYIHYFLTPLTHPHVTLTADATDISQGSHTTLNWSSQNASRLEITPDVGSVDPSGSRSVSPGTTTTYQITATGDKEQAVAAITVTVTPLSVVPPPPPPPPPPPIVHPPPPVVEKHGHGGGIVDPGLKPPIVPPSHFTLTVSARGFPIQQGQSFSEDDPNMGDLGLKSLTCTVHGNKNSMIPLELRWFLDDHEMTDRNITANELDVAVPYGNKPEPGHYKVQLKGKGVKFEVSFTITRGAGQAAQ